MWIFDKITKGLVYIPPLMFPGNSLGNIHNTTKGRLLGMYELHNVLLFPVCHCRNWALKVFTILNKVAGKIVI